MSRTWSGRSRTTVVLTARSGDGSVLLRRPVDVRPDRQHAVRLPGDVWVVTLEAPSRSRVELGRVRRPSRRVDSETAMWWRRLRALRGRPASGRGAAPKGL